jgi:SMI1-KNR4 cell-wall
MSKTMYELLDATFEEFPVLVAGPVALSEAERIERFAGFSLPNSYKGFVTRYGGAIVGAYSVFGCGASTAMGVDEGSAIDVTNRFRADCWPGSDASIVISVDHGGNAIMLYENGEIVRFDHDFGVTEILATSFEDFILNFCLGN